MRRSCVRPASVEGSLDGHRYSYRWTGDTESVSARTGLAALEAERRVDTAIASARNNLARARKSAVITAFMAGAAALAGAVAAWFASIAGAQYRDGDGSLECSRTPSGLAAVSII